jgi:hypothetical protein
MDLAAKYNITIEQGATFYRLFKWEKSDGSAWDISTVTLRMTIKDGNGTVIATSTGTSPTITLTDESTAGEVSVLITSTVTTTMDFYHAKYDIEGYTGATPPYVYRIVEGCVALSREQTT